jgi:hypothetical protein
MNDRSDAATALPTDEQWRKEMRVDIPVHADVICIDGEAGTSKALIVGPVQRRLTHIVVREHGLAYSERLVPTGLVGEASEDAIWLRCTGDELHGLDDFIDAHFVGLTYASPPVVGPSDEPQLPPLVISKRIPEGEIALGRWAVVEATDGSVGHVQSVVVDPANYRITHVVVRSHRFLSRQEVAVPVTQIARFFSDYIILRLRRGDVERLPHVPLHEAYLLPALGSVDHNLVPEGPHDGGGANSEVDVSHLEGAHLLADEVRARLRARGFTDEQVLDWAKAFLRSEHSGGDVEFLAWLRKQEHAPKPRRGPSEVPPADERHEPVLEKPADRS